LSYFFRRPPRFWPRRTFKYLRPIVPVAPTISAAFSADFSTIPSLPSQMTLSRASSATYFNSSGVLSTAASNVARFDYDPATLSLIGLLDEEQRTNYCQTGDFSGWSWPGTVYTVTAVAGLDGTNNAYNVVPSTATSTRAMDIHAVTVPATTANVIYSVYGLANGYGELIIREQGGQGNPGVSFNLFTGTIVGYENGWAPPATPPNTWFTDARIIPIGGGWYRCSVVCRYSSGINTRWMGLVIGNGTWVPSNVSDPAVNYTFAGNGTSGVIVAYPMSEIATSANQVLPTSYIYTSGAAATRSADIISSTDATWLGYTGWVVEVDDLQPDTAATLLGINTVVGIGFTSGDALTTAIGGTQTTSETADLMARNRGAIAWDSTPRVSISLDYSVATTAANTPVTPTVLYFGNTNNGASGFLNGHIIKIGGYTTVSDVELQRISAVGASFTGAAAGPSNAILNVSPTSAAAGTLSIVATSSFNATVVSTALGNLNMQAAGSLGVSPVIAAAGNFSATASAALAVTMASTALGRLSINAAAALSTATAINTTGLLNIQASVSLAIHPVIADTGLLNINANSALTATIGIAGIGGLAFTNAITLTAATGEAASAQVAQFGQIWIGANFDFVGPSVGAWNPAISDSTIVFTGSNRIATKPTAGTTGHRRVLGDTPRTDTTGTYFFTVDTLGPWGQIAVGLADSSEVLIDPVIGTTTHSVVFSYSGFIQGPGSFVGGDSQYYYGITGGRANNRIGTLWDPANSSVSFYLWYDNAWHFVGTSTGVSFSPCYPTLDLWSINDSTLVDFSPMNRPAGASPWNARQTGAVASLTVNASASLSQTATISAAANRTLQTTAGVALQAGISNTGTGALGGQFSMTFSNGLATVAGFTFLSSVTLATTAGLSASMLASLIGRSSLTVATTETASSIASLLGSASLSVSPVEAAAATAILIGNASLSVATAEIASSIATLIASATLSVAPVETPLGNLNISTAASLAAVNAITTAGFLSFLKTVSTNVAPVISDAANLSIQTTLGFAATAGSTNTGTGALGAQYSMTFSPGILASTGNLFISSITFAATAAILSSVTASLVGAGTFSVSPVETPVGKLNMTAAASLAQTETISAIAQDLMNMAVSFAVHPVETASLPAPTYQGDIALAVATALASTSKLDARNSSAFASTMAELAASTAFMTSASALAQSLVETILGGLSVSATASFAAHPTSANAAVLTVTGIISASVGIGGTTSSSATLRPLLIYSAVFGQESANRLTASDAITLATRTAISVVLESDHPSVAVIAARGVWSDVVNVSGVYSDTATLEGVMRLTIELAGVENALN
jgi:hypothetical protein